MPTVTTNIFREHLGGGDVSLSADSIIVSLMGIYVNSASSNTLKAIENWSSVSAYEVSGTGYTSGAALSTVVLSATGNTVYLDAADVTFNSVSVSAYGATLWKQTDRLVIGFIDFGEVVATSNANLNITWNSGGIINII